MVCNFDQVWSVLYKPRRTTLQKKVPTPHCSDSISKSLTWRKIRHVFERITGMQYTENFSDRPLQDEVSQHAHHLTGGFAGTFAVDSWRTPHTLCTLSWIDGTMGRGFVTCRADTITESQRAEANEAGRKTNRYIYMYMYLHNIYIYIYTCRLSSLDTRSGLLETNRSTVRMLAGSSRWMFQRRSYRSGCTLARFKSAAICGQGLRCYRTYGSWGRRYERVGRFWSFRSLQSAWSFATRLPNIRRKHSTNWDQLGSRSLTLPLGWLDWILYIYIYIYAAVVFAICFECIQIWNNLWTTGQRMHNIYIYIDIDIDRYYLKLIILYIYIYVCGLRLTLVYAHTSNTYAKKGAWVCDSHVVLGDHLRELRVVYNPWWLGGLRVPQRRLPSVCASSSARIPAGQGEVRPVHWSTTTARRASAVSPRLPVHQDAWFLLNRNYGKKRVYL